MRKLARRLIAFDAAKRKPDKTTNFLICEKLRPELSTLVGNEAFRAILDHALALAAAEVPAMSDVKVNREGMLEAPDEVHELIKAEKFFDGRVVLVARLLGLLVAFIGESLTLHLVRASWPEVAFTLEDFNNESES